MDGEVFGAMGQTLTEKILDDHLVEGELETGEEIGIDIDQVLTQDTTGTLVWLQFEALGLEPDEGPGGVLSEHLIDVDSDFLAGFEFAFDEVVVEDLLG